jgi:two-component system OmpR family sensor kinase
VRRIEAFRRARDAAAANLAPGDSPQLPLGDENAPDASPRDAPAVVQSFDFSTDPAGRIVWSDPQIAPMVAGIALGDIAGLGALILQHQPVRAVRVVLDGAPAIAGGWQVDASPGFDPQSGGFIGHLGRFRRRADVAASPGQDSPIDGSEHAGSEHASSEIDRLRQLLHELRTPVNAIQGFAEIIQQQLFGPTPHEYRALAAAVAADAAHMLAGFEELERFARLGNMDMELSAGESDLGACVAATVARLQAHTGPRGNDFVLEAPGAVLRVAMAPIETERLCWRLLATLAGSANPGETLRLDVRGLGDQAKVTLQLPETLSKLDDEVLLHTGAGAAAHSLAAGMFGTGFALRLAAREAAAAGGRLERAQGNLNLFLPMLAEAAPTQSDADAGGHPDEMKQATQSGA